MSARSFSGRRPSDSCNLEEPTEMFDAWPEAIDRKLFKLELISSVGIFIEEVVIRRAQR